MQVFFLVSFLFDKSIFGELMEFLNVDLGILCCWHVVILDNTTDCTRLFGFDIVRKIAPFRSIKGTSCKEKYCATTGILIQNYATEVLCQ